jgi:hypothetical protein
MIPVPEGIVIHFNDRLVLVGSTGEVRGADAIVRRRNCNFALPVASGILRCETTVLSNAPEDAGARGLDFAVVVQPLSIAKGLRIEGEPFALRTGIETLGRAVAADGWVLFSAKSRVIAVPIPVTGGRDDGAAAPAEGAADGVDTGG